MTAVSKPKSDLRTRALSAIAMLAIAGTALWFGGIGWTAFVVLVAAGVLWEWISLTRLMTRNNGARLFWVVAGLIYISIAAKHLIALREPYDGVFEVGSILIAVIGVDIGAYFTGRTIGGPKIAPSISPSKTWAGLVGGILGGGFLFALVTWAWPAGLCQVYVNSLAEPTLRLGRFAWDDRCHLSVPALNDFLLFIPVFGTVFAVLAQSGDFFESWMKRKAGVKDSSNLIPGHGGLFDRADGMLAVLFVFGLVGLFRAN